MPQIFIPHVMRTVLIGEFTSGTQALNVLHTAAPNTPVTLADVQAVNTAVNAWANSHYAGTFTDQLTITAIHTRSMEGLVVPTATMGVTIRGGYTTDALPYDVSLPVELTTNMTGAENSGQFWPFPATEAQNDPPGVPTNTYISDIEALIGQLYSDMITAGYPLVIASFVYAQYRTITGWTVGRSWGSQRRRLTRYSP